MKTVFRYGDLNPFRDLPDTIRSRLRPVDKNDFFVSQLLAPDDKTDDLVCEILQGVFSNLVKLFDAWVPEHLKSGVYGTFSPELAQETMSVRATNSISERIFGMHGNVMERKPGASTSYVETEVLMKSNPVAEEFFALDHDEQNRRSQIARKYAPFLRKKDAESTAQIAAYRKEHIKKKKLKSARLRQKRSDRQTELTTALTEFGFCQTLTSVDRMLAGCKDETAKSLALGTQICFRRELLKQNVNEKNLLRLTFNKIPKTIEVLSGNLRTLIRESNAGDKGPRHMIMDGVALVEVKGMIHRRVNHLFLDHGKPVWYTGQICGRLKGFPNFFELIYDCDVGEDVVPVWVFNLTEDLAAQYLKFL